MLLDDMSMGRDKHREFGYRERGDVIVVQENEVGIESLDAIGLERSCNRARLVAIWVSWGWKTAESVEIGPHPHLVLACWISRHGDNKLEWTLMVSIESLLRLLIYEFVASSYF